MGGGLLSWKWILRSRWMTLVAGAWIMCCAGASYLYGEYSTALKASLHYDQSTLDTVGFFKELGESVGLLSGLLYDVCPLSTILVLGVSHLALGYTTTYLFVSGALATPPVWAVSLSLFIGANGQTFLITAVLVTLVKRFPLSRGMVIGVMKGLVGLSAAVLTQFARVVYPESDGAEVLLFLGWFPAVVVAVSWFFFRESEDGEEFEERETVYLSWFAGIMLALAAFLMAVITLRITRGVCLVTLLLLLIPLGIVWHSRKEVGDDLREVMVVGGDSYGTFANLTRTDSFQREFPARGEDHTLLQALRSADFWLLVAIAMIGLGSGLTAMDNVGQVGASLGYSDAAVTSFVSMISIWNFLGRLGAGALSEMALHARGVPRPLFLMGALMALALGHAVMALALPGSLYVASILIGLSYGAHWSLIPTATSELFGLKHFGTLLNAVTMASPVGSYILSVRVAGFFYDAEARKQHPLQIRSHVSAGEFGFLDEENKASPSCTGAVCFRLTFLIMAVICAMGCVLCALLLARSKKYYTEVVYQSRQLRSHGRRDDAEQPSCAS